MFSKSLAPPYVDISLGDTVKQGEAARIQCTVRGNPPPTVQWYKDGQPLPLQNGGRMTVTSEEIFIPSTKLEDHGNYDCKATNENGEKVAHMMLDVMPGKRLSSSRENTLELRELSSINTVTG